MIRNTAFAEAFVRAAATSINDQGRKAPWMARTVVDRVTYTRIGTVRENDVHARVSNKTRQHVAKTCLVLI